MAATTKQPWIKALEVFFADDEATVEVLQQVSGYCLCSCGIFPCALCQSGLGRNSKVAVQRVLQSISLFCEEVNHAPRIRNEVLCAQASLKGSG